jgi:sugar phosphate isomerase/epimerase
MMNATLFCKSTPVGDSTLSQWRLPFRLGTTSYIIPDDILPNLRYLSGRVDDVELVLFESDAFSNLPSPADISEMAGIARESGLSFTVHLPLDICTGSALETERRASVEKCRKVIDLTADLSPLAWILHLHGDRRGEPPTDDIKQWVEQHFRSVEEILRHGPGPRHICVETLDYDFRHVAGLVEDFDLSVCLDIGHLLVNGRDVAAHLERWGDRIRVFHVHGVRPDGTDHAHLGYLPEGVLDAIVERLERISANDSRVVTLEIFGQKDFELSMKIMRERMTKWQR